MLHGQFLDSYHICPDTSFADDANTLYHVHSRYSGPASHSPHMYSRDSGPAPKFHSGPVRMLVGPIRMPPCFRDRPHIPTLVLTLRYFKVNFFSLKESCSIFGFQIPLKARVRVYVDLYLWSFRHFHFSHSRRNLPNPQREVCVCPRNSTKRRTQPTNHTHTHTKGRLQREVCSVYMVESSSDAAVLRCCGCNHEKNCYLGGDDGFGSSAP